MKDQAAARGDAEIDHHEVPEDWVEHEHMLNPDAKLLDEIVALG